MIYSGIMSQTATEGPRRHRLTVEDYYRMGEAGILAPDARVELIDGEIIDMAPPGSRHAGTVNQLTVLLQRGAGQGAIVQVQNPISLDRYSEPQPDLALLLPRADYYKSALAKPNEVILVVEVADTTLRYDRDRKTGLYARNGIAEVWLVDVRGERLTRYRDPAQGSYGRVDEPDLIGTRLAVDSLPDARFDLSALFAR